MARLLSYFKMKLVATAAIISLSLYSVQAQLQHGQLRKEVLESQQAPPPALPTTRQRPVARPMETPQPLAPTRTPFDQANVRIIYLENADLISFDQLVMPDVQVLRGNVRFRHDDAILTCDSAYFYRNTNSLDAFSRVRIVQGDTLFVYGDKLYYDGNSKLARLRGRVKLENKESVLTTDSLNYDRTTQIAYYFTGGKLVDPQNTLTSVWGQYSTRTEDALFSNQVKLVNKDFTMDTDTLTYSAKNHIANIVGPTHIIHVDETEIFTERGWYNTENERSMLLNRSLVNHKEGKSLIADTIFYDKAATYGESYGNVELNDTVQKTSLFGHYVYYNETTELGIATDSALLVDWSGEFPMYIHADTLLTVKDSTFSIARAWENVRFYREDLQGFADSLRYSSRDSILHFMSDPVVWQENQQLSARNITVYTRNQQAERIELQQAALSIEQIDTVYYNQLSGKEIIARLDSGELRTVEVNGNAETVYFAREETDNTLLGVNRTESSYVHIWFLEGKIDRVRLTAASSGTFYPLELTNEAIIYLPNFFWVEARRPRSREDVFRRFEPGERPRFEFRPDSKSSDALPDDEDSATTEINEPILLPELSPDVSPVPTLPEELQR